jgi:predicted dehydrogenase
MKKSPIRIGIIGFGRQGQQHAQGLLPFISSNEVHLVGVCDVVPSVAVPGTLFFTEYQELLKQKLDAVVITTPNHLHKEITLAALCSGCDVVKEKPFALNTQDGQEIIVAAEKLGRLVITTQQRYYSSIFRKCKEILSHIDQPSSFHYSFTLEDTIKSWYWDINQAGGGSWLNMGWHCLATLQWMFGSITDVQMNWKVGGQRTWNYSTDHSSLAKVEVNQGLQGYLFLSCVYPKQELLSIYAPNCKMYLTRQSLKVVTPLEETRYLTTESTTDTYTSQYAHIFRTLRHRRYDMKKDLSILAAIEQGITSQQKGHIYEN